MKKRYYKIKALLFALFIGIVATNAQVITKEDSLNAGLTRSNSPTVISGYGQAKVEYNMRLKTGVANLTRNVLFFGHRFNKNISFFSEMELENAGIDDGKPTGSVSMEQLFLKFNLNKDLYLIAGLFIPRIGMINENHLPTTFNGNDRHFTETLLLPSTWREIGISLYGNVRRMPGLNYTVSLMNGLNSAGFKSGNGIREGRFLGNNATASNIALSASLLYYVRNFRLQASGYFGGSAGLNKRNADSLMLDRGAFGTPVGLGEFNAQYHNKGMSFKGLFAYSAIPDAYKINRAYANNTPKAMMGGFFEAGYNLLYAFNKETKHNLTFFGRYEYVNLNSTVASNGIRNDALKQQYLVAGITYAPIRGVVIKADYVHRITGTPNPALYINPYPQALPYYTSNGFINIGIGYGF